jgi:hypothetical protein
MVLRRRAVSDVLLAAVLAAFFVLAIGLVNLLSRMIERDTDPDGLGEEPPDTDRPADQAGWLL